MIVSENNINAIPIKQLRFTKIGELRLTDAPSEKHEINKYNNVIASKIGLSIAGQSMIKKNTRQTTNIKVVNFK